MDILTGTTSAEPKRAPFRVGLVTESLALPMWVSRAIENALAAGRLELSAIVVVSPVGGNSGDAAPSNGGGSLLAALYARLERRKFRPNLEMFSPVGVQALAPERTVVHADLRDPDGAAAVSAALQGAEVDVVLNLTPLLDSAALASSGRIGAAAFALSDHVPVGASSDGIAELLSGEPIVRVRLELFRAADGALAHCVDFVTNAHPFSAGCTRDSAARHATSLLDRLLRDLALPGALERLPPLAEGAATDRPNGVSNSVAAFLRLGARYAAHVVRGRRFSEQWELAVSRGSVTGGDPAIPDADIANYRSLHPPADRFWADPFPLRVGGKDYIYLEELLYEREIGRISVLELGEHGEVGAPVPVLERPYHLSYPFIFEHAGETYLLPEMCLEGRLELYRATRLPYEWTLDRVIMEGPRLIDATLAEIDGRWWMFACAYEENRGEWNTLVLYHAPSPFGPWTPHQRNPVVSDVRCARPAGRLFRMDGAWHRPAQDCARSYGGAMSLRRIVRLNEWEYEEVEAARMEPTSGDGLTGMHTINAHEGLSVIDRRRLVRRRAD